MKYVNKTVTLYRLPPASRVLGSNGLAFHNLISSLCLPNEVGQQFEYEYEMPIDMGRYYGPVKPGLFDNSHT